MRSLFSSDDDLSGLLASAPNPKPTKQDKTGFGKISSLYTAFSVEFAEYMLALCKAENHMRVCDPFSGMGTLGEAARQYSVNLKLNDINPFAALSSIVRTSNRDSLLKALKKAKKLNIKTYKGNELEFFCNILAKEFSFSDNIDRNLQTLLSTDNRDNALFAYVLLASRIHLHKKLKGSNPTWTKKSLGQTFNLTSIQDSIETTIASLEHYAHHRPVFSADEFTVDVTCKDITELRFRKSSLDAIITSPPYPNRTDYFKYYLPAVELLFAITGADERGLRERQIGTPLIRQSDPADELPNSVTSIISKVKDHASYASSSYYYKGFLYYFSDMKKALENFNKALVPGGKMVIVVQDTHYKDLLIPAADLLADIAEECGFKKKAHASWLVRTKLSNLSPHTRKTKQYGEAHEHAILFSK